MQLLNITIIMLFVHIAIGNVVLTNKSQYTYEELIISIQNHCSDVEFQPDPILP